MIDTAAKIRPLTDALDWRARQPGPIVFTNGAFDLVHPAMWSCWRLLGGKERR